MALDLGTVVVNLAANVAQLSADMAKGNAIVDEGMGKIKYAADVAKQALGLVGVSLSAASLWQDFYHGVDGAIEKLAALDRASQVVGSSVENLSSLGRAAKEAGIGFDGLVAIEEKISRVMVGVEKDTGRSAEAFKLLGINVHDFTDTSEILIEVAKRMSGFEDSVQKSALATALLGRSGAEAIPFLSDLAEQESLQAKATKESSEQAEAFERNINLLKGSSAGFYKHIAEELLPTLVEMSKTMVELRRVGTNWLDSLGSAAAVGQDGVLGTLDKMNTKLAEQKKLWEETYGYDSKWSIMGVLQPSGAALKENIAETEKYISALTRTAKSMGLLQTQSEALYGNNAYGPKPDAPKLEEAHATAIDKTADSMKKLNQVLADATGFNTDYAEKFNDLSYLYASGQISLDEYIGATKRLYEQQPLNKRATEEQKEASKQLEAQQKAEKETLAELAKLYEASQKPLKDQTSEVEKSIQKHKDENDQVGLSKTALAELSAQREIEKARLVDQQIEEGNLHGALGTEIQAWKDLKQKYLEDAELIRQGGRLQAIEDESKKAQAAYQKTSDTIERSLTDALMRGFESGKGFAENLLAGIKSMFNTLILRPIIQAIVQPVSGLITASLGLGTTAANAASPATSILSSLPSALSSGSLASLFGGSGITAAGADAGVIAALGSATAGGAGIAATAAGSVAADAAGAGFFASLGPVGTALPWLGAGLAVASMLGLFGSKGGPKTGGSFSSTGSGIDRLFTPNDSDTSAQTIGTGILDQIRSTVSGLGGTTADLQLAYGYDKDPQGTAGSRVASYLRTSSGQVLYDNRTSTNVGRDDASFTAGVAQETARDVLAGILASDLPSNIADVFRKLDVNTVTADSLAAAVTEAKALAPKKTASPLDTALNDTGTQIAVSTEVATLIDVQRDALDVHKDARDTLKAQITQMAAIAAAWQAALDKLVASSAGTYEAVRAAASAPAPVIAAT